MDIDGVFAEIGELGPYQFKVVLWVLALNMWMACFMIQVVFVGATPAILCLDTSQVTCLPDGHVCPSATYVSKFSSIATEVFATLAGLHTWIAAYMIHLVYAGAVPDFSCKGTGGKRITGCADLICDSPVYSSTDFTSIVSEWNLVCAESYKAGLVQSVFMAGVLVGAMAFGNFSDSRGRRSSLLTCIIGMTVFGFISSFATGYIMYCVLRFAAGILCGGVILVSFVLSTEVVGASKRAMCGMMIQASFATGIGLFALTAYYIRNWRVLSVVSSLPGVVWISYYWYIPESPRWLLAQGRVSDAENVLVMIAKRNLGNSYGKVIRLRPLMNNSSANKAYDLSDIWSHKTLRIYTFIQIYGWFINSAAYYGLTMSAGALGSNRYISVALSGLVEIPAYTSSFFLLDRLGRRPTLCTAMLIGGASCMSILLLSKEAVTQVTALALLGKLSISASFAVGYIYSAELYPTVVRNKAMGVCSVAARFGGIMSPLIISLNQVYPNMQFLVFGVLALTAGLISLKLPETMNRPMPETLEDIDRSCYLSQQRMVEVSDDKVRLLDGEMMHTQVI